MKINKLKLIKAMLYRTGLWSIIGIPCIVFYMSIPDGDICKYIMAMNTGLFIFFLIVFLLLPYHNIEE